MWLVSCGTNLKLHNCTNYEVSNVYRPTDSTGQIKNISWCKDGSWLVLVPSRGNAEIIRTKDDTRLLQSILGIPNPTTAVFQKTTKKNVAMSTLSGEVLVYDIKARSTKKHFANGGSNASVIMMDWSLKDTHLATGSTDGQVSIYSNTTNQKCNVFTLPHSKSVSVVRFHPTQRPLLGTASDEGVVVVWDINTASSKLSLKPHKAPVTDLVFSSQNRNLMVSVGLDRTYQCYDLNTGAVALSVLVDHPLSTIDMAPDGFTVCVGSSRGTIYIYDLREHKKPLAAIAAHSGEIKKVLYQPVAADNYMESVNLTDEKPHSILESKACASDSFGLNTVPEFATQNDIDTDLTDHETDPRVKIMSATDDSFFKYLDNCDIKSSSFTKDKNEMSNLGISDGVKRWLDSRTNINETGSSEAVNERLSDVHPIIVGHEASSTPRHLLHPKYLNIMQQVQKSNAHTPTSSESSPQVLAVSMTDIKEMVRSTVNDVVKEHTSELMDIMGRQFLNLQLSICKQFVNQEMQIERLEDCMQANTSSSTVSLQIQQLQQENEFLKAKINELFRQKS